MKAHRFSEILLVIGLLAGCGHICDQACDAEADRIEECLPEWEMEWEDLGFAGKEAQVERCYAVTGDAYEAADAGSDERKALATACEQRHGNAVGSTDCADVLD